MRPAPPFTTLDDVVAWLGAWEQRFLAAGDRRAIFLTLYGVVSAEMRAKVEQSAFSDNVWVHHYAVAFASLYRDALEHYEAGRTSDVPKAWRLCFDAARAGTGLVLQDMFLGVNAHVNNDLAHALLAVSIDPDRARRHQDHDAVNAVLGGVMDRATQAIAALYAPGLTSLDACAGPLDEWAGMFSLQVARDGAWESAVSLANARDAGERGLVDASIAARAAVLARLLLTASLDPRVVAACRRLEQGPEWLTILAALKTHLAGATDVPR